MRGLLTDPWTDADALVERMPGAFEARQRAAARAAYLRRSAAEERQMFADRARAAVRADESNPYQYKGRSTQEAVAGLLNLDPDLERRGAISPVVRQPDGSYELAIPEFAVDAARAAITPGHAMRGGVVTNEDSLNTVLTVGAGGLLSPKPKGALGIFGGVNAKNAPLKDLAKAEAMEAAGGHADDIWRATGWGRGADGKWRFEIDDSASALSDRALGAALNSGKMRGKDLEDSLDGVINHPDLFDNYELDIKARLGNYPGVGGSYDQAGRGIVVKAPDPVEARATLLHETQHAVQGREGFARGGSPDEFAPHNPNSPASVEIARLKEYWLEKHGPRYDDLGDKMGAGTATPGEVKEFDALDEEWFSLIKRERENGLSAFDRYKRVAGETEARNVEHRRDWTPEMRRETPPWHTEDVPRDEQIVRGVKGDGVSLSARDGEPIKGLLSEGADDAARAAYSKITDGDVEAVKRYWGERVFETPEKAKDSIVRRIELNNKNIIGKPTDPAIVDRFEFKPTKGGYKIVQAPKKRAAIEVMEAADNAPSVDWGAADLMHKGSAKSVMEVYGRGSGEVKSGYIRADQLAKPKLAGGRTTYDWSEIDRGGAYPAPTIRINKNGTTSILDGNHRIYRWLEQGYENIPAYIIDERSAKSRGLLTD